MDWQRAEDKLLGHKKMLLPRHVIRCLWGDLRCKCGDTHKFLSVILVNLEIIKMNEILITFQGFSSLKMKQAFKNEIFIYCLPMFGQQPSAMSI